MRATNYFLYDQTIHVVVRTHVLKESSTDPETVQIYLKREGEVGRERERDKERKSRNIKSE